MRRFISLGFSIVIALSSAFAQEKDPLFLTVGNKNVPLSEFKNVYFKNSANQTGTDEKALKDYVELFINFKLKVKEAEELGLDTTTAFKTELLGYRKQLAQPYLTDNNVNEALVKEAYERSKLEINASHILISLAENALPKDTLIAYNKALKLRERILKGDNFGEVARRNSDDPSAKDNEGNLGYFTVLQMVYPFETAAYNTEVGKISMPVRTKFGYHLVKVHNKREARGQILVAHLMVENAKVDPTAEDSVSMKNKIDELYKKAKSGEDFAELARQFSDDRGSARKGGELPWFGTGRMVPEFENASFVLASNGDISEPFQTRFGWHVVKRIDKKDLAPFDEIKNELKNKISKDSRSQLGRSALVEAVKKENNFKENLKARDEFIPLIDSKYFLGEWSASVAKSLNKTLFTIGSKVFTQKDFADYLESNQSKRAEIPAQGLVNNLYSSFVENSVVEFEESKLEQKYPEFKALMQEYRDGILLFELTDKMVWSKAVNDTVGLEEFYEKNKNSFMWDQRLHATVYSALDEKSAKQARKLATIAKKKGYTPEDIVKILNKDSQLNLKQETGKFQKGENNNIDAIQWKEGFSADIKDDKRVVFIHVYEKLNPQPKSLKEARGAITSEYQAFLEKQWLDELKAKYPVTVNTALLENFK
jgi:peptidyl-prolyl cis-trans isomerase SurA